MELQTRLVFIDTSAYEKKRFQFGLFVLGRLEKLVNEEKIHLLITDVVQSEIEAHLKKFAEEAVTELKKFQKNASFLHVAEQATGGGLFIEVSAEAVLGEANAKFRALMDNGLTEHISIETVNSKQIFEAYFSGVPPFHRAAKKSEFPDAFTLAAVDALARERMSKIYIVSHDTDMKAVAESNDHFIHLEGVDELVDLVNRNDEELRELSVFADKAFERVKERVMNLAKGKLEDAEYIPDSSGDVDPELNDLAITDVVITQMQLIDVSIDGALYDVTFGVTLEASYDFADYSCAHWDREDRQYYGVKESSENYIHREQYGATLEIGFATGLIANAEVIDLAFDNKIFDLDMDNAQHLNDPIGTDDHAEWPDPL